MAFDNNLRHIKVVLYKLTRNFGLPIKLRDNGSPTLNKETGIQTKAYDEYRIRRAIVLQGRETKDFVYDLSFIAANKNFTYGAFFHPEDRVIIIRRKDIPRTLVITHEFSVIFEDKSFTVKSVQKIKANLGYLLHVRGLAATPEVT